MNKRAFELGMTGTVFENTNGLDDTAHNHVTTARDIAKMSAELITKHPSILEYSSIWMDSIRGGEFGLTNTNRLIRFYNGANGLKTGSTAKAGFCISASAKRDGMQLICVVMAASTRDSRNEIAKKLFDFGFANYRYEEFPPSELEAVAVKGGTENALPLLYGEYKTVLEKKGGEVKSEILLPEYVSAPIKEGDTVGSIRYTLNGETLTELPITAAKDIPRIDFAGQFLRLLRELMY
jgi:D-alanyl-D-alanine carboxypeptidase (penicillin-binding protein 5/6)